jgi:hypothetical protein
MRWCWASRPARRRCSCPASLLGCPSSSTPLSRALWLGGERPVGPCEPPAPATALDDIAALSAFGQRHQSVARGTTHLVGQARGPASRLCPHPEGVSRSVRTVEEVAGPPARWEAHLVPTVGTAHGDHEGISRSRWSRPRSKPTMTSSSTVITGTAVRPVRATSSSRAAESSATFLSVNGMP